MKTLTKLFITLTAALTISSAAASENAAVQPADTTLATTQIAVTPLQLPAIPGSNAKSSVDKPASRVPALNLLALALLGYCGYATYLILQPLFKKQDFNF
ncbi:MAG: hypothetical protein IKJ58_00540 [Akkermansia sp.]|nr:hypothetical protein [Akkermansia sp.]